jgi:hypothetical protein
VASEPQPVPGYYSTCGTAATLRVLIGASLSLVRIRLVCDWRLIDKPDGTFRNRWICIYDLVGIAALYFADSFHQDKIFQTHDVLMTSHVICCACVLMCTRTDRLKVCLWK